MTKKKNGKKGTPIDLSRASFSIIKQRGSPTEAVTVDGLKVRKQDEIYCENPFNPDPVVRQKDIIRVRCVDYHNEHFVYLEPNLKKIRWFAWCTCGSPAAIVRGTEVYDKQPGVFLGCVFHMTFGRHVTGDGRRWM